MVVETGETMSEKLFSQLYNMLRKSENRIYSDDEVLLLPEISLEHPHAHEWKTRKLSALRLRKYLEQKNLALSILEVGCGNGWLSNLLSSIEGCHVTGIDLHEFELLQAKRIFRNPNLEFLNERLENMVSCNQKFDILVFAASAQYFSSFDELMEINFRLLKSRGEVHFIDSHFYSQKEKQKAELRSKQYFESVGLPEMIYNYHHHSLKNLKSFSYRIMNRLELQLVRMMPNANAFPWVRIVKHD